MGAHYWNAHDGSLGAWDANWRNDTPIHQQAQPEENHYSLQIPNPLYWAEGRILLLGNSQHFLKDHSPHAQCFH